MPTAPPTVTVVRADARLAQQLAAIRALENQIATHDEQLKDERALLKQLTENELAELVSPDMLADDTLTQVGSEFLRLERKMYCGIDATQREAAHLWLEDQGHGAMLKRTVTLSLPKDSRAMVARLQALIKQLLPAFEVEIIVPPRGDQALRTFLEYLCAEAQIDKPVIDVSTELPGATLGAFVRKQLKAGAALPPFFNVYSPVTAQLAPMPDVWRLHQDDAPELWYHRATDAPAGPFASEESASTAFAEWYAAQPIITGC